MVRIVLVCAYLGAIVAANLTLAEWGASHPEVALYNAFLLIGLDLTSRDVLHGQWASRGVLLRNMVALIAAGSAISYVAGVWLGTGPDVGRIALASCVAFGAAATCDAIVYHEMRYVGDWLQAVNGSNLAAAAVDSLVFVALWPFGFDFTLAFTLFAAKVAGGVTWSLVLKHVRPAELESWDDRNRRLLGTH